MTLRWLLTVGFCVTCAGSAWGMDRVTLKRDGRTTQLDGRVLVTAEDGGLLLQARDGVLWAVKPEEKVRHVVDQVAFEPYSREQMAQRVLAELPLGFKVHHTAHYSICYNTSQRYAQWCGGLFERLYRAFRTFWTNKGLKLTEPEFPLVAVVFASQNGFTNHARGELGDAAGSIIGYYSLRTNRMTMYDLTGVNRFGGARNAGVPVSAILAQPEALRQVATVVHEATHQIAFSCGLHVRYSDCPMWVSEGIAVYFETPDLRSSTGWRGIGAVNRARLTRFRQYLRSRPPDSLKTMIAADDRFRSTEVGLDAYAEAWALTYFLTRRYPKQYIAFLEIISRKPASIFDGSEKRVAEFEAIFGDLKTLDTEFLRHMQRVR